MVLFTSMGVSRCFTGGSSAATAGIPKGTKHRQSSNRIDTKADRSRRIAPPLQTELKAVMTTLRG
jgi:hypothetical protein